MPSSNALSEGGNDPQAVIQQFTHWLAGSGCPLHHRPGARRARGPADAQQASALELGGRRTRAPPAGKAGPRRLGVHSGARDRVRHHSQQALASRRRRSRRRPGRPRSSPASAARSPALARLDSDAAPSREPRRRAMGPSPGAAARPGREPPRGVDPVRQRERRTAHSCRGRHRLGQDRHPDLDRRTRDRARDGRGRRRPQGRSRHARAGAPRGGGRRKSPSSNGRPTGDCVYNPYARGSETRDRRQGPGRRALHRAALPAPGSALPRSRRAGPAPDRNGGQSPGDRGSPGPWAPGGARPRPARGRGPRGVRLSGFTVRPPAERAGGSARSAGDPGRVRRWAVAGSADGRRRTVRPAHGGAGAGGGLLQPRVRQPAPAQPDARRGDRAGPADDRGGIAGTAGTDAGGHRRVLRDRRRSGGEAVRPCPVGGVQPAARHAGALGPQTAWTRAAARAGAGQPLRAHRPPSGGSQLGRADLRAWRARGARGGSRVTATGGAHAQEAASRCSIRIR